MNDKTPADSPEDAIEDGQSRRFRLDMPEGWVGIFLLLILAALSGGLIASYWPTFMGGDAGGTQDRLAALETRVGQIAAGRAGAAATGVFDDLRRDITTLGQRLDAGEARIAALESGTGGGSTAPLSGNVAPLQAALADVTARLTKLEQGTGTVSELTGKVTALETRITKLEQDITQSYETRLKAVEDKAPPANLAQRLDSFALKSAESELDARVKALEELNSGERLHRAAQMLALTQLAHAANETDSFQLQLDTYAAAAPSDPMVVLLRPYAGTGVPSRSILSERFPSVARAALDAERSADARSLFAKLWANLRALVSVRRVGEAQGGDTESKLARAQTRLDSKDLAGAAREVRSVQGVAAKPLARWLNDAYARVTLERAVSDMEARVVQALAEPIAAPATPAPTTQPAPVPAPAQGGPP